MPNKTGSLRVHPYVGFIKDQVDLNKFNRDEVSSVFTLPVDYLIRPDIREIRQFRDSKQKYTVYRVPEHIEGDKEIWGLTSYILDGKDFLNNQLPSMLISSSSSSFRCISKNDTRTLFLIYINVFIIIKTSIRLQ